MSKKNISRSKKHKKTGCGCNKSFRLWGGKRNRGIRKSKRSRKTVRGGEGFVNEQTFPYQGGSDENTIPLNTSNGGAEDPSTPANIIDARQTNLF